MRNYRVGIIGLGRPWKSPGATGFGTAHAHAKGYRASPETTLVALADIDLDSAQAFQSEHGGESIYQDYRDMLFKESLDIVSICTWTHLHPEMVAAAAEAGVRAIHCEKPMATTFAAAQRMVAVCEDHRVQLTFNHQRRFEPPYRRAKEILASGAIGPLTRLEAGCPNLFDWGTHWFDMLFFYNDETPVEWVIGQVEPKGGATVFGITMEEQGLSYFKYRNGVHGLLLTGHADSFIGYNRLVGQDGQIEIDLNRKPQLRAWVKGQPEWQAIETEPAEAVTLGILDLIEALKTGREPELSAGRALRATELIFATYESSRRRGRVELPLEGDVAPFPMG